MVSALDTRDAIFSIIDKILNEDRRKNRKAEWKSALRSTPYIFEVWIPIILFALAFILGVIYGWANKPEWLRPTPYILILLIYASLATGICVQTFHALSPRRVSSFFLEKIRKRMDADAPRVTELSKYSWQDLEYVHVELKAERGALERRVGVMIGALEKVGLGPGILAAAAAIARLPSDLAPWIQGVAFGAAIWAIAGIFMHARMIEFDRVIMLLEKIIDTKKSGMRLRRDS